MAGDPSDIGADAPYKALDDGVPDAGPSLATQSTVSDSGRTRGDTNGSAGSGGGGRGHQSSSLSSLHHKSPLLPPTDFDEEEELLGTDPGRAFVMTGFNGDRPPTLFRWPPPAELDTFLTRVYAYYQGKGIYCIVVNWITSSLIWLFTTSFSVFLLTCIDYRVLFSRYSLPQAIDMTGLSRMPAFVVMCLVFFCLYWVWSAITFAVQLPSKISMYRFFAGTLNIPDRDMQTIEWNEVVRRLLAVQPTTQIARRLDEFELANRVLRRDNYLIGLMNHDALRLSLQIGPLSTGPIFTKYMEWFLKMALQSMLFDEQGQLDRRFLSRDRRDELAAKMRVRFLVFGLLGLVFAPFMFFLLLATFLFRYGEEIHRDPRSLSARLFTPYARYLFREFNEYPHLFERRVAAASVKADEYVRQFPSEKIASVARLVAFVSGAFAVVLACFTIIDEEALLTLEITPGRTVLWYLGIFSAVFAMAHSLIPEDSSRTFRPAELMREIAEHTHYMPTHWLRALHADTVRREFAGLYQYRVVAFLVELFGIITVPLILIFGVRSSAADIVDFVRESSVTVERVGVVCCFATAQLGAFGDRRYGAPVNESHRGHVSRNGKMERSVLTFMADHPQWVPPAELQRYVEKLRGEHVRVALEKSTMAASGKAPAAGASTSAMADMQRSVLRQSDGSLSMSGMTTSQMLLNQLSASEGSVSASQQPGAVLGLMELLDRIYATQNPLEF